ncbi:phosphatidylserine decarboxylase [Haematospirillum jordaniae]|uniref:Phosphatidylserine decarboxylase proenzyme n=1 Tax=Haematospirillum jordaniae TaxID=1549855 RepID=A0A143DD79_9PROT|nr:phosphatidylserine decarboxylase [Haematospirillum jordaniae]AMW34078.1 phosphatidylserine decarboxylase [Haematospirillum jordaniae]
MKSVDVPWSRFLMPPLHEEGPRFLAVFAALALVLYLLTGWPGGLIGLVGTVWCFFFFRDPVRYVPTRPGLMISPASGVVQMIGEMAPPPELGLGDTAVTRVSVFMSVFDCHVNRIPCAGEIRSVVYKPGRFVNATLDKASEDNERNGLRIALPDGREYGVVQIAGLIARRIRCDVHEGQTCQTGDRFGLIRFGSRLDIYLPPGTNPLVVLGQVCVSGETVLADLTADEPAREGKAL